MLDTAKPEEIHRIVELVLEDYVTRAPGLPEANPVKIAKQVYACMVSHPVFCWRVDGVIQGFILLADHEFWWSDEPAITDILTYVAPEHRSFKAARYLVEASKRYASERGVKLLLGIFGAANAERTEKLMKRFGMKKVGAAYGTGF